MTRIIIYWLLGIVVVSNLVLSWKIYNGPVRPFFEHFQFGILWTEHPSVLIGSLFMLPLVLIDTLALTNHFAGPVFRLRRAMRELAAGQRVEPVRFRDGDFWKEMAQEFNMISAYVEQLKKQAAGAGSQEIPRNTAGGEPEIADLEKRPAVAVESSKNFAAHSLPAPYESLTGYHGDCVDN